MDVKTRLAIERLVRAGEREQVEDGLDVGVEAVVALAGESEVATFHRGDALGGIMVQLGGVGHPVLGQTIAVVTRVVERCGYAFVVGRADAAAEHLVSAGGIDHPMDVVGLDEVLVGVAHVIDHAQYSCTERCRTSGTWSGSESGRCRWSGPRHVVTDGDVEGIAHVVVEVEFVRPDAGLLEGKTPRATSRYFTPLTSLRKA